MSSEHGSWSTSGEIWSGRLIVLVLSGIRPAMLLSTSMAISEACLLEISIESEIKINPTGRVVYLRKCNEMKCRNCQYEGWVRVLGCFDVEQYKSCSAAYEAKLWLLLKKCKYQNEIHKYYGYEKYIKYDDVKEFDNKGPSSERNAYARLSFLAIPMKCSVAISMNNYA
jgi:hypothetical protein